ncbi:MAG: hypothetical protein LIO90_06900 [Bacteroidales bacterium]|nr:hypothetical protein [Bacteroidales bacterium]
MLTYYKSLLQLVLAPSSGWEDLGKDNLPPRWLLKVGLIPLIAITALTVFLLPLYHRDCSMATLLQHSIVIFIKYFLTYFIASFMLSIFLPMMAEEEVGVRRRDTFILYSLSLMAVIGLLQNCFPIEMALTYFLPLYVAIVMWRGMSYLCVPQQRAGQFMALTLLSIIAPPYLLGMLFGCVIPPAF